MFILQCIYICILLIFKIKCICIMEKNKNEYFLRRTNFAYQLILNLSVIHLTENIFILKIIFLTIHRNNQMVNRLIIVSCCRVDNLNVSNKIMCKILTSTVTIMKDFLCSENLQLILLYIGELIFSNYLCQFVTAFDISHENIRLED